MGFWTNTNFNVLSLKVKELEKQVLSLQQAASEKEVKQKREKQKEPPSLLWREEPKVPAQRVKEEVQEEVVENGFAAEVEKELALIKIRWDTQSDNATAGNVSFLEAFSFLTS